MRVHRDRLMREPVAGDAEGEGGGAGGVEEAAGDDA